jgi:putative membrane protein
VLLAVSAVLLAAFVYDGVLRPFVEPVLLLPAIPGGVNTLTAILTLFSLTHASHTLGWRHAIGFFAIGAAVSWAFEQVGVETGAVYGSYQYTDALGAKLGHVPILIPLAWFMMLYPSYVITNLIVDGRPTGTRGGMLHVLLLALLGAVVMTAWDLLIDPILSGPRFRAWVWEDSGPYFGIPTRNYAGWILTTFTVFLVYRLTEHRWAPRPLGDVTTAAVALPLVAYGAMLLANLQADGAPAALVVIGPLAMGPPLLAAIIRLANHR